MELAPLLAEIEALVGLLCTEEGADPGRIRAAVSGAVAIAPALDPASGRALVTAVHGLREAADAHQQRTADRLRSLRKGRRAMKGYGSLRSHKSGQRVRTKV